MIDYGDLRAPERFWVKVYPEPMTGCWLWGAGQVASRSGVYGKFWADGATHVPHRWLYLAVHGPIPDGWEIDHRCRQRLCVRLDHLEAVPQLVNWQRSSAPSVAYAAREHCPNGDDHEWRTVTTKGKTSRRCYTCRMARQRERSGATPRQFIRRPAA